MIISKTMRELGPMQKKILLLLVGGLTLSLTHRPDVYFRVVKKIAKEWKKINELALRRSIKRLYQSKLIDYKENGDGTVKIVLSKNGKNKILKYNLDKVTDMNLGLYSQAVLSRYSNLMNFYISNNRKQDAKRIYDLMLKNLLELTLFFTLHKIS